MQKDLLTDEILNPVDKDLEAIRNFKGAYPKQIWSLFFSEMWERFCFYGMRGMLMFFMMHQLGMGEKTANLQYGATQAFVYAFTFLGGLIADKLFGFRRSLFWGGLLMIIGSVILTIDPKEFFFWGITFNIVGTGFFKPNISTMVGDLYHGNDNRRVAGFNLFYTGINLGALLGGYFCVAIGKHTFLQKLIPEVYSWNVAFGLSAVVMTISLITFLFTQKNLGTIGLPPLKFGNNNAVKYSIYAGSILIMPLILKMVSTPQYTNLFMYIVGPLTLLYLGYEMITCTADERKKLFAALIFIFFSIVFWAFFEQSGGSLSSFAAGHTTSKMAGMTFDPNGVNNSANSFFVIAFAWIAGLLWVALSKKKIEPNSVVKFGLGFIFLAAAFYIFYYLRFFADANAITPLSVFTLAYFVMTIAEICLSPIGLTLMTTLAPKRLGAVMMGMWFLASAYGQYVAGILGAGMSTEGTNDTSAMSKLMSYTTGYKELAIYALLAGVIMIAISPLVKKLMGDVK